jgi:archaellum component FlaC
MKPKQIAMTMIFVTAFTAGCSPGERKPVPTVASTNTTSENAPPSFEQVKKEAGEAAQATKDYAYVQKSEFVAKMHEELATLNQEIERISAQAASATENLREEAAEKVKALREKAAALSQRLDDSTNTGESAWDTVKTGFKQAHEDLKQTVKSAGDWFREKTAR